MYRPPTYPPMYHYPSAAVPPPPMYPGHYPAAAVPPAPMYHYQPPPNSILFNKGDVQRQVNINHLHQAAAPIPQEEQKETLQRKQKKALQEENIQRFIQKNMAHLEQNEIIGVLSPLLSDLELHHLETDLGSGRRESNQVLFDTFKFIKPHRMNHIFKAIKRAVQEEEGAVPVASNIEGKQPIGIGPIQSQTALVVSRTPSPLPIPMASMRKRRMAIGDISGQKCAWPQRSKSVNKTNKLRMRYTKKKHKPKYKW